MRAVLSDPTKPSWWCRAPDRHPDREELRAVQVVVHLAAGELERGRVDASRKLLAAALAMLDDVRSATGNVAFLLVSVPEEEPKPCRYLRTRRKTAARRRTRTTSKSSQCASHVPYRGVVSARLDREWTAGATRSASHHDAE